MPLNDEHDDDNDDDDDDAEDEEDEEEDEEDEEEDVVVVGGVSVSVGSMCGMSGSSHSSACVERLITEVGHVNLC